MANLSFIQKQLIENVFDMGSGYFLDFTNREFEDFMKDVINYSISNKYSGLSKAKMFRAFYNDEEDRFVGKAIVIAINYMKDKAGPMGFVMMDFAGDDDYQGQELIDLIINNCFSTYANERDENETPAGEARAKR